MATNDYTGSSSGSWSYGPANPYNSNIGNGALPQGFWGSQNRAYTRNTQGNELVSNQMNGLLAQNSPYIQDARRQGYEYANSRGGLNSSIAAGAAQRSAIQAGLPIAQGDATAYQNTAAQNQQWLNQQQMALEANAASMHNADTSAGAQLSAAMYGDDTRLQMQRENLAYGGEQAGLDRSFQDYMLGRGYQNNLGLGQQQYYNQMGLQNNAYQNQMGQSMFDLSGRMLLGNQNFGYQYALNAMNNPAIMGNPQASAGYVNFWQNAYMPQVDAMLNNLFGGGY